MEIQIESSLIARAWYDWSPDMWEAVEWARLAMRKTAADLAERVGEDATDWPEFERQLDITFLTEWRYNALVQYLLWAATKHQNDNPLLMTDDQWTQARDEAQAALALSQQGDTTYLHTLAAARSLGDAVQLGWVAETVQPEFTRDFANYVNWYMSGDNKDLPTTATIGTWFGTVPEPQAIVDQFQKDLSNIEPAKTMDQIRAFYLPGGEQQASDQLQNEELDPDFVEEILALFASEAPLDEAGTAKVPEGIDRNSSTHDD